ncbi:MAG: sialidase family protein [Bryobacteraceae bacterium]|nr:sialidase family protein [Bryobacteraceae bacterium]
MRIVPMVIAATLFCGVCFSEPRHVVVYKQAGRFGGWPANHGAWAWGNELVVGFEAGHFKQNDRSHAIDYSMPAEHVLARSTDGGETWKIEKPESLKAPPGIRQANVPTEPGKAAAPCPGGINFQHPDFAMTWRMASIHTGPSRFYYSYDRGKTWQGPFEAPDFGTMGVAARTDYLVNGRHDATVFLTAAKKDGKEGRVFCARTTDGGKSWKFLSYIGEEPPDYAIMPSSVRIGAKSILTTFRRRPWIEAWRSDDDGMSWKFVTKPVESTGGGNPPSMVKLKDGRLVLTYGYRSAPFSIRARVSGDNGATWGEDMILRQDGGAWDLGYTRTLVRPDGKLVTVYYYNDNKDQERYIGATIWQAP